MKSTGNGNGNGHHTVGTISLGAGVTRSEPFDNELIDFSEGEESFAAESSRSDKRRKNKRVTGVFLLLLLVASVAVALYFMFGGKRTPVNLNVRDTRTQAEKTQAAKQSPEDVTSQAIAEVRSATGDAAQPVSPTPGANTTGSRVSPTAPVTIPVDGLGGTVAAPVPSIPSTTGALNTTDVTADPATTGTTTTVRADKTSTSTASHRNPERSIRCALPIASSISNPTRQSLPQRQTESDQTARTDQGVVLPSFGSMLPVRSLGVLYTLRSGSLTRFELTRDMRGQGWAMKKGTVIVGVGRGSEYDRAFVAFVGFIDSESGRFVKFTGDVLGGGGGAGLRGRRRSLSSAWSRAFSRIGISAVNVAGLMLSGLGRSSVVVSDAYGYRVVNPVTSELSGLGSERTSQQPRGFVEVPAVRDKPGLRESIDLLEGLTRDGVQTLRAEVIDEYLCFLGKRQKELMNLRQGIARLEFAVHTPDREIDEWVEWACGVQEAIDESGCEAVAVGAS